jgi:hypothetical protein
VIIWGAKLYFYLFFLHYFKIFFFKKNYLNFFKRNLKKDKDKNKLKKLKKKKERERERESKEHPTTDAFGFCYGLRLQDLQKNTGV